jgi:hypothetical protein
LSVAVLLLALAALGTRARRVTPLSTSGMMAAAGQPVSVIAGALAVAAACLLLAGMAVLLPRRRRRRDDDFVPVPERVGTWWQRALVMLAMLAFLALLVTAVVVVARSRQGGQRSFGHPAPLVPALPHLSGAAPASGSAALIAVAALTVLAGLVLAVLWRPGRRRPSDAQHRPYADASPLAAAVAAGSWALVNGGGAREAIISCYAAMEDTLAAAGSPRRPADTPEELLDRAVAERVIGIPAAERLTALFREARYSPHQLGDAQRSAARAALDAISRDVAG